MKILCHTTPVLSVAVDAVGKYMATSAVDRKIHLWDLRQQTERVKLEFFSARSFVCYLWSYISSF